MVGIKRNHPKKKVEMKHTPYSEFAKAMQLLEAFDKTKEPTESEALGLLVAFETGAAVRLELLEEARKYPPDSVAAFALVNVSQNLSVFLNEFFKNFNKEKSIADIARENGIKESVLRPLDVKEDEETV